MKSALPLLSLVITFASCTAAYKAAQTPDDVYFSPSRPQAQNEYVQSGDQQDRYNGGYDQQAADDRYLRMKVHNPRTWSDLDYYYSDPYAYNYSNPYNTYGGMYYSTPWNYYSSWNYYYNPYSSYYSNNYYNPYYNPYGFKSGVVSTRPPVYNHPRTFNLNVYNPPSRSNGSYNGSGSRRVFSGDNRSYYYNSGSNSSRYSNNSGSSLRSFFNNNSSNNSSSNSFSRPSSNASSSSSSSGRSSGGGGSTNAGVRRF